MGRHKSKSKRNSNTHDKAVRSAFLLAFERLGGLEGLVSWASDSPANLKEFYKLLLTTLPKEVEVGGEVSFAEKLQEAVRRSHSLRISSNKETNEITADQILTTPSIIDEQPFIHDDDGRGHTT